MTTATEVVIASAARTAIGTFNGGLSTLPASELGRVAISAALERAAVAPEDVSEVILGQVLSAGTGQNPARQAAIGAGIPIEKTALTINQVCGSGLRAVAAGYQAIRNGDSDIVVAGGQESMSLAPHCAHLRNGQKLGPMQIIDSLIVDGLWDAFNGYHMGTTAENVAKQFGISREMQDAFAAGSQQKGRGGAEGRPLQRRDYAGHGQRPQGRHDRRYRWASAPWHHRRESRGFAPGL